MARCHALQSSRNAPASAERRAVASSMMSDRQRCEQQDWAANWLALAALWGLPTVAMLLALLRDPIWRAVVWIAMLASMGAACVINARRCGRTHCRYTGPFFSRHGRLGDRSHCRLAAAWQPTLAGARHLHCGRQRPDLVGQRTCLRDIFRAWRGFLRK